MVKWMGCAEEQQGAVLDMVGRIDLSAKMKSEQGFEGAKT